VTVKEAKQRWICTECGHICFDEFILEAPNPFDVTSNIAGCPDCKAVDSFNGACMDEKCRKVHSSGTPNLYGFRYLWLCWDHSPNNKQGEIPVVVEIQSRERSDG